MPQLIYRAPETSVVYPGGHIIYNQNLRQHKNKHITKTCLYNFDPLKPQFYIVELGFTGVYIIFLIFAQKYRL